MIPVISSPTRSWYSSYIIGLANPLQNHLLGGLGGDPAEVFGGDVAGRDLILVGSDHLRVQLGILGLAHFAGLGIDLGLLLQLGGLGQQLLLQLRRQDQLEHQVLTGFVVEVDPRVFSRARGLLVRREEGVLEGVHQLVGGDSLLCLERFDRVDDFLAHWGDSSVSELALGRRYLGPGEETSSE
jgi:hypothetical protein